MFPQPLKGYMITFFNFLSRSFFSVFDSIILTYLFTYCPSCQRQLGQLTAPCVAFCFHCCISVHSKCFFSVFHRKSMRLGQALDTTPAAGGSLRELRRFVSCEKSLTTNTLYHSLSSSLLKSLCASLNL